LEKDIVKDIGNENLQMNTQDQHTPRYKCWGLHNDETAFWEM